LFFYPLSVKKMLKMHQKPFGGRRAPPGPAGSLSVDPRPSSRNMGPTSKWREGIEGGRRGWKGGKEGERGEGRRERTQPDFLATPLLYFD